MKKTSFLIFMLVATLLASAQVITDKPYVEKSYRSSIGWEDNIIRVAIDDDETYVFFESIVPRTCQDCWVSLSSNTKLSAADGSNSVRITSWGIFDEENPSPLQFNERYSVKRDRRYVFYMVFPRIKPGIERINVIERTSSGEGWAWRGVHINNPASSSYSSKGSSKRSSQSSSKASGSSSSDSEFSIAGTGTCFAISENGYLATCYHVVENAESIRIRGINGDFSKTYNARVVINDKSNDLAIVKIDDAQFTTIDSLPYTIDQKMADVGEDVFALGYPLKAYMGDEIKLTNGIVSSRTGYQGDATSYQLSVAVYPGNSGGPLFNNKGNVVGVVNARLLESATYAVKTPYLHTLAQSADGVHISGDNQIATLSLADKVKQLRKFVYIIEIGE